jgi:hypothetical protein
MNIYKYHFNPESLDLYEERLTRVPILAFVRARKLGKTFPEGEAAIAKSWLWKEEYQKEFKVKL